MSRWQTVPAGELLEMVRRPIAVQPDHTYTEIGIRSFGKGIFHKERVSGFDIGEKRVFEIHPDELVVNIVFAWEGAVAIAGEGDAGTIGSHRFLTYRADSSRLDLAFVHAYLTSDAGREALLRLSPGAAGRNRTLSQARFSKMPIPLPSRQEQHDIVSRLMSVERLSGKIRDIDSGRVNRASGLIEQLLSRCASDETRQLGAVLRSSGTRVPIESADTYRIAGVLSHGRGMFWRGSKLGSDISYSSMYRVRTGQIVLSKLFGWEGAIALCDQAYDGAIVSSEFPIFDVDVAEADPAYVRAVITRPAFYEHLDPSGIGNRRQRVQPSSFLAAEIPMPALPEQTKIGTADSTLRKMGAAFARRAAISASLKLAAANRIFTE